MQYWILPLRGADLHRVSSVSDIVLRTRLHLEFNSGGERGIRTPETLAGLTVFKTVAIDHSAISPKTLYRKMKRIEQIF